MARNARAAATAEDPGGDGFGRALIAGSVLWAVIGSVLLAAAVPGTDGFLSVWLRTCLAAVPAALVASALVTPVDRALARRGAPLPPRVALVPALGLLLGVPFEMAGLLIAHDAGWWLLGSIPGLWCGALGAITAVALRRRAAPQIAILAVSLALAVAGLVVVLAA